MKLTIIIPVTGEIANDVTGCRSALTPLLSVDTELEFLGLDRGFPTIESETQALVNGAEVLRAAAAAPAGAAGSGRRPERPAPRCGSCTKYTTGGAKKKAPEGAFSYVQNVDFSRAGWPPGRKS